ncbi:MAG: DUF177 domain-containing protein [Candidatus Latescibacteria bacterium]|nr:DUF177 domain-containing protein [Candidatus Latescibacterota bacterium]
MLIDLQTLSKGPRSFDFVGSAEELDLLDIEMTRHGVVQTSCVATLTGGTLFVEGLVFFQATMECCRCLKEFPVHLRIPFRRLFQKRAQDQRADDDDEIEWIARDTLSVNLKPTIREAVILEIPMKPLCSEGCIGFCPHCGQDLNKGSCGCHTEEVDPRWEPLRNLMNV